MRRSGKRHSRSLKFARPVGLELRLQRSPPMKVQRDFASGSLPRAGKVIGPRRCGGSVVEHHVDRGEIDRPPATADADAGG